MGKGNIKLNREILARKERFPRRSRNSRPCKKELDERSRWSVIY